MENNTENNIFHCVTKLYSHPRYSFLAIIKNIVHKYLSLQKVKWQEGTRIFFPVMNELKADVH